MSSKESKTYLGDSVYARFEAWDDGDFDVILTTENGYGPTNTIVIDAHIYEALEKFIESKRGG